jgi:hypothetical protein
MKIKKFRIFYNNEVKRYNKIVKAKNEVEAIKVIIGKHPTLIINHLQEVN